MKKTLLATSILALGSLIACNSGTPVDYSSLKIISPSGAPSVAFYNHSDNENFETNASPSNIIAFMAGESEYDVVVIDTVSGIRAINNGASFKLAANITLGNFFIASTGNDEDGVMNEGDTIVLFGQNQTPDLVFHYIYGNEFDSSIEYVASVKEAAPCLASGRNVATGSSVDYVFIAEPVLTATLNNANAPTHGSSSIYANVQDLYRQKSNGLGMIQASVFVNSNSDSREIDAFLSSLKDDIESAIENPQLIVDGMGKVNEELATALYGVGAAAAKTTVANGNRLGLGYIDAKENKAAIDNFVGLFGLGATDASIYY